MCENGCWGEIVRCSWSVLEFEIDMVGTGIRVRNRVDIPMGSMPGCKVQLVA
jgi:hypothetical protein